MAVKIQVKDRSRIVKRKIEMAKERSLRNSGPIGVAEMQNLVPIDTWSLHDSVRVVFNFTTSTLEWIAGGTNTAASQINDPVVYAQVVEFGRRDLPSYPAQPFFVPGLLNAIEKIRTNTIATTQSIMG